MSYNPAFVPHVDDIEINDRDLKKITTGI